MENSHLVMVTSRIPHQPGVYLFSGQDGKFVYIGKAKDLRKRLASYFQKRPLDRKLSILLTQVRRIDYIVTASEREALILENRLIKQYQPRYNVLWRDDKSYPYLKLTVQEDFPRLYLTRKIDNDGAFYFGPYPQVGIVQRLLSWLKKIFPLRPCKLEIKTDTRPPLARLKGCLYAQIGECPVPCLGKITHQNYQRIVREVKLFLEGAHQQLANSWEKEMRQATQRLDFERAAVYRDRLQALAKFRERVRIRQIQEPLLSRQLQITQALQILQEQTGLSRWPQWIEGFDISNLGETSAVGSLVVFLNGEPEKGEYRRYRIRTIPGQDDYAMLAEVVGRRYRRLLQENKELPDLVLLDGGKGQLKRAKDVLGSLGLDQLPVIALAKEEEKVYLPKRGMPVPLALDSPALLLLEAVRDEAHRFALSYHRLRRKKRLLLTIFLCLTLSRCFLEARWGRLQINGEWLEGDIQREKGIIHLNLRYGSVEFLPSEVEKIVYVPKMSTRSPFPTAVKPASKDKTPRPKSSSLSRVYSDKKYAIYQGLCQQAAQCYRLDPAFLRAVIQVESDFEPTEISPQGAQGLMQLLPETARGLGVKDPLCPEENVFAGARLLRYLLDYFQGNLSLALAAYNAGRGTVERYRGIPPYPETQRYVERVLKYYQTYRAETNIYVVEDKDGNFYFSNIGHP